MSGDGEVDVTLEDQQRINEFSRLNSRKDEVKQRLDRLQKKVQDLDDASEGILMSEGAPGDIKVAVGESFADIDADAANAYVDKAKAEAEEALSGARAELAEIERRQGELKVVIKARLGDAVNLEDNPGK